MGLCTDPELPDDSEVLDAFKSLYDESGDSLALQYGGSGAVKAAGTYQQKGYARRSPCSCCIVPYVTISGKHVRI